MFATRRFGIRVEHAPSYIHLLNSRLSVAFRQIYVGLCLSLSIAGSSSGSVGQARPPF